MELDSYDQAVSELLTIRDFIRWGASQFEQADLHFGHGTDNAWDEAVAIVLKVLALPSNLDMNVLDARLVHSEKQDVVSLIKQRIEERMPLPYLTNEAWFCGMPFYVDKRVLIPRSPIGELIQNKFSPWLHERENMRILDMCTGSGCIGIACAMTFPDAYVDIVDNAKDAIEVAKINIEEYNCFERVRAVHSNLFAELAGLPYSLIVSNPPYVGDAEIEGLPTEYTHEPVNALQANNKGLAIVIKILQQAAGYLTADGILIVEVGNSQKILQDTFPDVPFLWLDFENGGDGVFMLTADQLKLYSKQFNKGHS